MLYAVTNIVITTLDPREMGKIIQTDPKIAISIDEAIILNLNEIWKLNIKFYASSQSNSFLRMIRNFTYIKSVAWWLFIRKII